MQEPLPPAKITDRFLAFLIDLAPFAAGFYASLYALIVRAGQANTTGLWRSVLLAWVALYLAYQAAGNRLGATVGKRLFGIAVVGPDGAAPGLGRGAARALGYLVSLPLNAGFLWSLIDARSRAWHDMIAGTVVVEARPRSPLASVASAAASFGLLFAAAALNFWWVFRAPTPADERALSRAREGLAVLAEIQEAYRAERGRYSSSLVELARASGDPRKFRAAMEEIFQPDGFVVIGRESRYELRARARDRRKTVVTLTGP